jgi:ABC-type amino acid transport substrate-binding protein
VTAGTTNEAAMRELARKFKIDFGLLAAADHAASFAMLTAGQVDAFATDDVLLYGLLAEHGLQAEYRVTGEFLSYDPYAIMFRRVMPSLPGWSATRSTRSPPTARSSAATTAGSCASSRRARASTCR